MKKYVKPEIELIKFEIDITIASGAMFSLSVTSGVANIDGGSTSFMEEWFKI